MMLSSFVVFLVLSYHHYSCARVSIVSTKDKLDYLLNIQKYNTQFKSEYIRSVGSLKSDPKMSSIDVAFSSLNSSFNVNTSDSSKTIIEDLIKSFATECFKYNKIDSADRSFEQDINRNILGRVVITLIHETFQKNIRIPELHALIFFRFIFRFCYLNAQIFSTFDTLIRSITEKMRLQLYLSLPGIFNPNLHRMPIFCIKAEGDEEVITAGITYIKGFYDKTVEKLDPIADAKSIKDLMCSIIMAAISSDFYDRIQDVLVGAFKYANIRYLLSCPDFVKEMTTKVFTTLPDSIVPILQHFLKDDVVLKLKPGKETILFAQVISAVKILEDSDVAVAQENSLSETGKIQLLKIVKSYNEYISLHDSMIELNNIKSQIISTGIELELIYFNLKIVNSGDHKLLKSIDESEYKQVISTLSDFLVDFFKINNQFDYTSDELAKMHFKILVLVLNLCLIESKFNKKYIPSLIEILEFFNQHLAPTFEYDESVEDGTDEMFDYLTEILRTFVEMHQFSFTIQNFKTLYSFLASVYQDPKLEMNALLFYYLENYECITSTKVVMLICLELEIYSPVIFASHFQNQLVNASLNTRDGYVSELLDFLIQHQIFNKTEADLFKQLQLQ